LLYALIYIYEVLLDFFKMVSCTVFSRLILFIAVSAAPAVASNRKREYSKQETDALAKVT
jgi:hypothetical protein